MGSLRTSNFILDAQQHDFYHSLKTRKDIEYYSILRNDKTLVGLCGFVNLNLVNRNAEIALIINPHMRGEGIGRDSFKLLLDHGFNKLGLRNIYGESYACNENHGFWENIIKEKKAFKIDLPERKFFDGTFFSGVYFNFKNPNI